MLSRRTPMKPGSGFRQLRGFQAMDPERARAAREASKATNIDVLLATRGREGVTMGGSTTGEPIDKEGASQSQAYQVAVRSIGYCMRCGCHLEPKTGVANFCHADEGKGQGIKTDVRRGWLGCAACHHWVGRIATREVRRAVERFLAWKTRTTLRAKNLWPKSLPDTWRALDADPMPNPEAPTP